MREKALLKVFRPYAIAIIYILSIVALIVSCEKKPSEPDYANPFDPQNEQTGGDPFNLTAIIAGGGITLQWNRPDFDDLQYFKIYRSEQENTAYTELETVTASQTQYIDKNIENGHSYWYRVTAKGASGNETKITNTAGINIKTEPVLVINGGDAYTTERGVSLTILAISAAEMILSNSSDFRDSNWESYSTSKSWTLTSGAGQKTVFMKVKYDSSESVIVEASILPQEVSNYSISISDSDSSNTLDVTLYIYADHAINMMISNDSSFAGVSWENYNETKSWHLDISKAIDSKAKVYIKFKNDFGMETDTISDEIYLQIVSGVKINNDDTYTSTRAVTLNIFSDNADEMMISDNIDFNGANWEAYTETKNWTLPTGTGPFNVYAKFKNISGLISKVYSDAISPQPINPSIEIAGGVQYSSTRDVQINLSASGANLQMKLSEDSTFTGINWQSYSTMPNFQLSTGEGTKKVFAMFKNDFEMESLIVFDEINPQPISPAITIAGGAHYSTTRDVQLSISATGSNLQMKLNEDSTFSGITWQSFSETANFQLSTGEGEKTVYAKLKNDFEIEADKVYDDIIVDTTPPTIALTVNPDSGITDETSFEFDPTASSDNLSPAQNLQIRFDWENDDSYDTDWQQLSIINHQYSIGGGDKMIKMQLKDGAGWQVDTTVNIFVNTRPQASFTAIEDDDNLKLYHFDASASSDYEDGKILEYRWDFDGDGSWDIQYSVLDTISYEYNIDGDYAPKLSVRDQNSLTDEITNQVTVPPSVTDFDGNVYKIVKIGNQWWMAENLKVTRYRNGEIIPNITDNNEWANLNSGARCSYNNDNGHIETYGLLYNWHAVNDSRTIAPSGWHVPTDEEWQELEMYLGMSQTDAVELGYRGTDEGGKMKEIGTIHWNSPNTGATDESGFSALPGGVRHGNTGRSDILNYEAYFWSSTPEDFSLIWYRSLGYSNSDVNRNRTSRQSGFSVRCVRD
jgi:uncharacterized protein (TIGR02145 family)